MTPTVNHAPEQWGSHGGFILATIASAIGLGNIWRFAYVAGDNGGGTFLLVYVASVLLVGLPIMLAEFAIGARARSHIVGAFTDPKAAGAWRGVGWLIALGAFVILSYYSVIAGWTLRYLFDPPAAVTSTGPDIDAAATFAAFLADPWGPLGWHVVFMGLTIAVVTLGVQRGIEALSRVLMPVLAAIVLLLAGYSLSLGGAAQAAAFLFAPDWSRLGEGSVYIAAVGQAFFSLGAGMGVLATYAAYVGPGARLGRAALVTATADTLFALVAGIAIFAAVFAFGSDPAEGPALAFVTLPRVFAQMPGGTYFAGTFFFLLAAAALTSAVSLLEVPVALLMRQSGLSRRRSTLVVGLAALAAGVPSALGSSVWQEVRLLGRPILEAVDYMAADVLLPLAGAAIALFAGWVVASIEWSAITGIRNAMLVRMLQGVLRWFVPAAMLAIVVIVITR